MSNSSEALQRTISDDDRLALALAIVIPPKEDENGTPDPRALPMRLANAALAMGIGIADLAELLNDASFLKLIRGLTKSQMAMTLHGPGMSRLTTIIEKGRDREALTAIKLAGFISGDLRPTLQIDHRVTFDDLRKKQSDDPLSSLFDIRSVDVIDAEIEEEER